MQESYTSPKPDLVLPRWVRIGTACLMFTLTGMYLWRGSRFEWVPWLCYGLSLLLHVPRPTGQAFTVYANNPRAIVSLALMVVALVGFGHNLLVAFAR